MCGRGGRGGGCVRSRHLDAAEFVVDLGGGGGGFGCAVEADDVADEFDVFAGGRFAKDTPEFFDDVFEAGTKLPTPRRWGVR